MRDDLAGCSGSDNVQGVGVMGVDLAASSGSDNVQGVGCMGADLAECSGSDNVNNVQGVWGQGVMIGWYKNSLLVGTEPSDSVKVIFQDPVWATSRCC